MKITSFNNREYVAMSANFMISNDPHEKVHEDGFIDKDTMTDVYIKKFLMPLSSRDIAYYASNLTGIIDQRNLQNDQLRMVSCYLFEASQYVKAAYPKRYRAWELGLFNLIYLD